MRRYFVILVIVGFLLYLPSLFGPFIWDDEDFVYANQYVANFQVDKFFTECATCGRGKLSNYFRPVQETIYSTTHTIFGFNPFWYHLLNITVHIAAAGAVFVFFRKLTKNDLASMFVALFFLVHPVQTEAVSYISGLSDALYVLFGFLSLIYFPAPRAIIFFILALLSKETALVFLPLLALLNYRRVAPYFLLAALYLWYHFTYLNKFDIAAAWGQSPYTQSVVVRLLTFIQSFPTYLGLLVAPINLFMERDFSTPIQTNPVSLAIIGFVLANAAIIYFLYHRCSHLLWFCYLAFYISFVPYTGIVLINGLFYEHFLYLPLVFFFAFLILLLPKIPKTAVITVLVLLAVRNLVRQWDWTDAVRFYSQTLSHAPKSVRIINGLGMAYADAGNSAAAIATYQQGIAVSPNVPNFYHNLANAYLSIGATASAETNYLKAIEVDPKFIYSWQALASFYQQTGQTEKLQKLVAKYQSLAH